MNHPFDNIKAAILASPRGAASSTLHIQILKYHEELKHFTGKEFCHLAGLPYTMQGEFAKMMRIAPKLVSAGLKCEGL